MAKVKPIPDGMHTIVPYLTVRGAAEAVEFYKKAFGAVEMSRMPTPDGKLLHAHVRIGDSNLMMSDEFPGMGTCKSPATLGSTTVSIHLNVEDVDAAFQKAVAAGAKVLMPPMDMFWGDRFGKVADPFGHEWSMATHKEDVSQEEMKKRGQAMFAKMEQGKT